jgi:hypothetical protein
VGLMLSAPFRVGGGGGEGLVLSEPPGGSFDVEDDGAVDQAVQDGGGDDGVAEDVGPFGEAPVGGDQGGAGIGPPPLLWRHPQ